MTSSGGLRKVCSETDDIELNDQHSPSEALCKMCSGWNRPCCHLPSSSAILATTTRGLAVPRVYKPWLQRYSPSFFFLLPSLSLPFFSSSFFLFSFLPSFFPFLFPSFPFLPSFPPSFFLPSSLSFPPFQALFFPPSLPSFFLSTPPFFLPSFLSFFCRFVGSGTLSINNC